MNPAPARRATSAAALLWSCAALFASRVVGQLEALLVAPAWLPDMDAWYSGLMPYPLLLPAQIAILMLMAVVAWNRRVRGGNSHARIRAPRKRCAYWPLSTLR